MRSARVWCAGLIGCTLVSMCVHDAVARARIVGLMTERAGAFLSSLSPEQRSTAILPFDDENRFDWHFIPRERRGVALKVLNDTQRGLAISLMKAGLSSRGFVKAEDIQRLENVLREIEGSATARLVRDPDLYYFSIFGTPSGERTWGWRVEGHHLSLNYTIVQGKPIATSPSFMGANPARVPRGPMTGHRALAAEEDLGRRLVHAFDAARRAKATIDVRAPADIVTANAAKVDPLSPTGLAFRAMTVDQQAMLRALVMEYVDRMPDELAEHRRQELERSGWEAVSFAWAGGVNTGDPHYYRVQGPTFLVEYDNTQNDANHIHTVWRDFAGDFGRDLLREHFRTAH